MERPAYNGTFCATASWSKQVGFQIEYLKQQNDLLNIRKGAARICYRDTIYKNGWAHLEVETQRNYPDWVQAFGAGMLEGSLTWSNIYYQWFNTIESSCNRDDSSRHFCTWLRDLLTQNYEQLKALAAARSETDRYFHQLSLYFIQLEGLEAGYERGARRARTDLNEQIPLTDLLLMNSAADIQDLKIYYENYVLLANDTQEQEQQRSNFFLPSATMLTKIFKSNEADDWKLLFGHSTAGSYASMLRIQKRYKFHYHNTPDQRSNTVPGVDIMFTGYPGILGSTDDFYIIKGRQLHSIVAGVGIKNDNLRLWQTVDVKQSVPLAARVMAANRISQNQRTWAKAMSRHPSTGSKQWVNIDLNKLNAPIAAEKQTPTADDAAITDRRNKNKDMVWIVEQLPGRMHLRDVTESFLLNGNTTWVANGVPYFDEILEASGIGSDAQNLNEVIAADDAKLNNLEAVDIYLRHHGFRGDLLGEQAMAYGNIDIKLYSYNAHIGMSDYHAFAGPVYMRLKHEKEQQLPDAETAGTDLAAAMLDDRLSVSIDDANKLAELEVVSERRAVRNDMKAIAMRQSGSGPFRWSDVSDKIGGVEHERHPNEWDFEKVSPKWSW